MKTEIEKAIKQVLQIPQDFYRYGNKSWNTLMAESGFHSYRNEFTESAMKDLLQLYPNFISDWLQWSEDTRSSSTWYFTRGDDGKCFVGHWPEDDAYDELNTNNQYDACAYFIKRLIETSYESKL